jgi:hypothetical protein
MCPIFMITVTVAGDIVRSPRAETGLGWYIAALIQGFVLPVVSGIWPFLFPVTQYVHSMCVLMVPLWFHVLCIISPRSSDEKLDL